MKFYVRARIEMRFEILDFFLALFLIVDNVNMLVIKFYSILFIVYNFK